MKLRHALAQALPRHPLREAWPRLLRESRADARATGERLAIADRAALERALDGEVDPADPRIQELKAALAPPLQAARAQELLRALGPRAAEEPVRVELRGWPSALGPRSLGALTGLSDPPPWRLSPARAALLRARLHGRILAGAALEVEVELPPGAVLPRLRPPPPRRPERAWLPHLDEEGRVSLSPRALAAFHASLFPGPLVVDAFCGAGGDALALAGRGLRVLAVERDARRAALARQNARALGLPLEIREGDARRILPTLPPMGLFLDPPWGGPGANGRAWTWEELVDIPPAALSAFDPIVLKAPRSFDPRTLPAGWTWSWRLHLVPSADPEARDAIALTCRGQRRAVTEGPSTAGPGGDTL